MPPFLRVVIRSAAIAGASGGMLSLILFSLEQIASITTHGAPGGFETLAGILGALVMVIGTLPLRYFFSSNEGLILLLLLPFNLALWGAAVGVICGLTRRGTKIDE